MKILITGASGQLGNELQRILQEGAAEIGPIPSEYNDAEITAVDIDVLDLTDADAVLAFVKKGDFNLIINGAAMTNVDGCESSEATAYLVNAEAAGNLAKAASQVGAKFVHVSTDYVFPGTDPVPRVESDEVGPVSAYGRTKLAGEQQVAKYCKESFIVRTAWLYGYVGNNFVKTMRRLGEKHPVVTVVDDQLGNPTSANDLAYEILCIATTDHFGVYHCTNEGTCSWADFAESIMNGLKLPCKVKRCSSAEYKQMNPDSAVRPAYSSLRNKHLEDTVGNQMRPWDVALSEYLSKLPSLEQ